MKTLRRLARLGSALAAAVSAPALGWATQPSSTPAPLDPQPIWLPGAVAPCDIHGNSAVANAPRPGETPSPAPGNPNPMLCGDAQWGPFGPSGADAQSVSASPTVAGVVIAGASSSVGGGAIYRTTNSGSFWSAATGTGNRSIREVEFASNGTGWAATDNGLFRSTDGGATWSQVTLPVTGQALVEDVVIDAANPSIIMIGLGQFLGGTSPVVVLRSVNGGGAWTDVSPPVTPGMGATVVALDPANPQRVYAAFTGNFGSGSELWGSDNGGTNWTERSGTLPNVIINDVLIAGARVYVAGGQDFGSQFMGLYRTDTDGAAWENMSAAWPSRAATSISIDPANPLNLLVGTTRAGLARSTDGGASWSFGVGGTLTYQVNDIEFVPGNAANVFLGLSSVAIFRSTNSGASFTPAASGMSRLEITSFAVNPANNNEIAAAYVGLNDGGIFISTDGGGSWTLSQAPLPRWQAVYFSPAGVLYGTHDGPLGRADDGLWRRNTNGTWTNLGPGSPSALDNIGLSIAATPGPSPVILWGGYRWLNNFGAQVWSYNRIAANTWEREYEGAFSNEQVQSVLWLGGGAGPAALAGIVNFGSGGAGGILRSVNSGDSWARSETNYPAAWNAWEINQGPQGPDTVYVSASANTGDTPAAVFKSTNGGQSWNQQGSNSTFRNFAVDPDKPGAIYGITAFNNARPLRSIDDGLSFQPFDTGFLSQAGGRAVVYGGVVEGHRRLYVSTSEGGFATDLTECGIPCIADFNQDGGVDGGDVEAFFVAWERADSIADVNQDGGVDGADVEVFFIAWESGEC